MTDDFIQRVETLSLQEKKSVQKLISKYSDEQNLKFKLDSSVLETINDHRVCYFLQWDGGQLTAYMVSNYFNETEMEITLVGVDKTHFTDFIDLASSEATKHGLTKLLLIVDEMDKTTIGLAEKQNFLYSFSEYRLVFQNDFSLKLSMSELVLRAATSSDKSIISQLDLDGFGRSDEMMDTDLFATQLAIVNQQIIGKIRLDEVNNTLGIYGFVVFESERGKGYGKEILSRVIHESQLKGISHIYLEVALDNPSALKLYEQCGFKKQARFDYYQKKLSM
ncbi:TPA: GNAT family N-acetyltransferase [Enterococcus faecium]